MCSYNIKSSKTWGYFPMVVTAGKVLLFEVWDKTGKTIKTCDTLWDAIDTSIKLNGEKFFEQER